MGRIAHRIYNVYGPDSADIDCLCPLCGKADYVSITQDEADALDDAAKRKVHACVGNPGTLASGGCNLLNSQAAPCVLPWTAHWVFFCPIMCGYNVDARAEMDFLLRVATKFWRTQMVDFGTGRPARATSSSASSASRRPT